MRAVVRFVPLLLASGLLLGGVAAADDAAGPGLDRERLADLVREAAKSAEGEADRLPVLDGSAESRAAARRIGRVLATRKVTVRFEGTRLEDALDFIRDVSGLNLVLDATARKEHGERPVTLRLTDIGLGSCLELVLAQASADLGLGVKHGVLWVAPRDALKRALILRLYPVDEVVAPRPDHPAPDVGLPRSRKP